MYKLCILVTVSTEAEFRFEPLGENTRCVKNITYECPFASIFLCYREVMHQQKTVMSNLQKHFTPQMIVTQSMWYAEVQHVVHWIDAASVLIF